MSSSLESLINRAWEMRAELSTTSASQDIHHAVSEVLEQLDQGLLRIAQKNEAGEWVVKTWLKKAVLLAFRIKDNQFMSAGGYSHFYDKIPSKFVNYTPSDFAAKGVRVAPPAMVRHGAFIAPGVVLMPSYVNIGAYVGEGTMIDTWATVGSCAQIGRNVHLSGGVGIGGVLEPLQTNPVIIEDHCFIGARSEIVEGVIIGKHSVLSMGVFIGQSTKIYDRQSGEIYYGRVPPASVVVPGSLPSADGKYSLYAAIIVKKIDAKTDQKTALNTWLRSQ